MTGPATSQARTGPATSPAPGAAMITAAGRPVRSPGRIRGVLCLYCRTEKFVYWPPASRLRLADCPGCQRWTPMPCSLRA